MIKHWEIVLFDSVIIGSGILAIMELGYKLGKFLELLVH